MLRFHSLNPQLHRPSHYIAWRRRAHHSFLHAQVHPPTGVTHCVSAYLTRVPHRPESPVQDLPNVIIARSTQLEIYDVEALATSSGAAPGSPGDGEGEALASAAAAMPGSAGSRLRLIAEYPLAGVVETLAVLPSRSRSAQRDSLVLTFRDAKVGYMLV